MQPLLTLISEDYIQSREAAFVANSSNGHLVGLKTH